MNDLFQEDNILDLILIRYLQLMERKQSLEVKLVRIVLKSYLSLTRLFKAILHNFFKVKIDLMFIKNQTYTSQLVNVVSY